MIDEPKICAKCKHHQIVDVYPKCFHPSLGVDIITGKQKHEGCALARTGLYDVKCGIEGKLFERRDAKPTLWDFIKRLFK